MSEMMQPTPSLAEYRRRMAEDDNEFWRLASGDHLNLLDEAIERIEELEEAANKTAGALGGSTERPVYNPRPARLSRGQQPNVVGEAS